MSRTEERLVLLERENVELKKRVEQVRAEERKRVITEIVGTLLDFSGYCPYTTCGHHNITCVKCLNDFFGNSHA